MVQTFFCFSTSTLQLSTHSRNTEDRKLFDSQTTSTLFYTILLSAVARQKEIMAAMFMNFLLEPPSLCARLIPKICIMTSIIKLGNENLR